MNTINNTVFHLVSLLLMIQGGKLYGLIANYQFSTMQQCNNVFKT